MLSGAQSPSYLFPEGHRPDQILTTGHRRYGHINILVNNASQQYMCSDLAEIDLDTVEDVFKTNIIQMFAITKFALPHMGKGDSYVRSVTTKVYRTRKANEAEF